MDELNSQNKKYTPKQAKLKMESFCAYQERAQQEVREKLYSFGLYSNDVENIIAELISDNFLNEERFAKAFVRGKFRLKKWGKIKIIQHLKAKRVSAPLIKIALLEIDVDEYEKNLDELIDKKVGANAHLLNLNEKSKLMRYLQSKGYENELIYKRIH